MALSLLSACDEDGGDGAPATREASATTAASPTPELGLSERIGVRGGLPVADLIDLAERYGVTEGRAAASKPFVAEANVGDSRSFYVSRITGAAFSGDAPPDTVEINATLVAKSGHAYFYLDDVLDADAGDAQDAADSFEANVWPQVTGVFGTPATPGVDGDPRILVLQADLGGAVGGYFSGDDGYLRAIRPFSNEAEMVYIDRTLRLGGKAFDVVLAHELQHLIHSSTDGSEEAWINEGLGEASSGIVGGALSSIDSFAAQPDIQLNAWGSEGSSAHYGAGAAFTRYVANRFGGDPALGELARQEGDGEQGVDEFLDQTGAGLDFGDVFADWITANVLDRVEGPYANPGDPVEVAVEETLAAGDTIDAEATQFGTDYYFLDSLADGPHELRFDGAPAVDVLPGVPADAGILWSNAEDDINTTLTRAIDLTDSVSPAVTFRTWYDIEPWYDWAYVAASTDGGETWRALTGEQTTTEDPVRIAYGPGYTGTSGAGETPEWVDERIDLSAYAGQRILLRFEYVTDGSTYGEGWAIDEIGLEGGGVLAIANDDPEWDVAGWIDLREALPQQWIVRLIGERADGEPVVIDGKVDDDGNAVLPFDATGLQDVVLAVAGATEGTRQPSPYSLTLSAPP